MPERLFVIDGPASIYQAFHAISAMSADDGQPTGALYGFVAMMTKLMRNESPEYLAIAWDPPGPTFRHEITDSYKATRASMPEDLVAQLPTLRQIIAAMRIPFLEVPGYEADDVMATLARRGEAAGLDVVLVTRDKDAKQLLSDHVFIYDSKNEKRFDQAQLLAETGLKPEQWVDYQSLVGDSTDNVKGAPGIGDKTATKLLTQHGSIAALYENLAAVEPPRVRNLLDKGRESVQLAARLVRLDTDMPLACELQSLARVEPDREALAAIYRRLGFRRFLEDTGQARSAVQVASATDYVLIENEDDLERLARELAAAERIGLIALPVSGRPPATARLAGLGLSARPGTGAYVPIASPGLALSIETVKRRLAPIFARRSARVVCHDLKAAQEVLASAFGDATSGAAPSGAAPSGSASLPIQCQCDDTTLLAYLLSSTSRSYHLDALALQMLDHRAVPLAEVLGKNRGKDQQAAGFETANLARVTEYAAEAADLTLRLHDTLSKKLEEAGLAPVYRNIELPLVPVLARIEMHGMLLDSSVLARMSVELDQEIASLQARAEAEAGEPFNLGSTKQLARLLFEVRKLEPTKKGKTGPSTDAESLEAIHAATGDPLCALILRWRELTKLKSTYVDALPAMVDPGTGRIHTTLHQAVASTGRLSSSDPNLQNIPVRTDLGRRIRSAFIAAEGKTLVTGDYSQIELRVLAHYSGDEQMISAFKEGQDIHARVAAQIAGVPYGEATQDMRRRAKAVNFGILYGQSAFGLSKGLGISQSDAKKFIDDYFANFQRVRVWIDETIAAATRAGEVRTLAGRRRAIPDLDARDRARKSLAERTAVNTVIQGSAADIIKLAMIALDRRIIEEGRPERIVLQIHDELVLEVEESAAADAALVLAETLQGIVELAVPLDVSTSIARDWGALEH